MSRTKFWLDDPLVLFQDLVFFPSEDMTRAEKLNALTRLCLIITIVLFFLDFSNWYIFLLCSILIILILQYSKKSPKEKFTKVPVYASEEYHTTVPVPTFSEEWQGLPPAYEIYESEALHTPVPPMVPPVMPKRNYPYGQYLTKTDLLPADEFDTHMGTGGSIDAKKTASLAYLRHRMGFQENMSRVYKKSLARRYQNSQQRTFSPTF